MGFLETENSNYDGCPVHLYKFTCMTTEWLYTSADRDITLGSDFYEAIGVSDDGISQTGEVTTDAFTVHMPTTTPYAQRYIGSGPSAPVTLTVWRFHYDTQDAYVVFIGQVTSVQQSDQAGLTDVIAQLLTFSLDRQGLRLAYERTCPHALYDRLCGVDRDSYVVPATVELFSGNVVQCTQFTDLPLGYLAGGYLEWETAPGTWERRGIEYHVGHQVQLLGRTDGITANMLVNAYPGCQRTPEYCVAVFNNLANYGGIPCMPGKSPFAGDPIF